MSEMSRRSNPWLAFSNELSCEERECLWMWSLSHKLCRYRKTTHSTMCTWKILKIVILGSLYVMSV